MSSAKDDTRPTFSFREGGFFYEYNNKQSKTDDTNMKITGSVITEQGQTFALVLVKEQVLNSSRADDTAHAFSEYFPGMPIVLAAQNHRGRFTYYGRKDISAFLASVNASRIPWKEYSFAA